MVRRSRQAALGTLLGLAAAVAWGPVAAATVPPKNCGMMTVSSKRYQIKADQMRCSTAKTYSRRYLASRTRPSGYRCTNFTSSKLKFRCAKGDRTFFAIKR